MCHGEEGIGAVDYRHHGVRGITERECDGVVYGAERDLGIWTCVDPDQDVHDVET